MEHFAELQESLPALLRRHYNCLQRSGTMFLPVNRLHGCGLSSPEPSKIAGDEGQMFTFAQGMLIFAHASFAPARSCLLESTICWKQLGGDPAHKPQHLTTIDCRVDMARLSALLGAPPLPVSLRRVPVRPTCLHFLCCPFLLEITVVGCSVATNGAFTGSGNRKSSTR